MTDLTEQEYLDIVERSQRAMLGDHIIIRVISEDLPKLLAVYRDQEREIKRLLVDNAELSDECDQWQRKLDEVWAEVAALRAEAWEHDKEGS